MTISLEAEPATIPAASDALRFVSVRANLLPAEVLAARAADVTRKRVLVALGVLAALLALLFGASWWQTHASHNDLAVEQHRAASLQAATKQFAPLVTAQQATDSVHAQLERLMTGDVSWQQLLSALQAQAPRGVTLTQISGTVGNAGGAGTTNPAPTTALPPTGVTAVGSLTVVGAAPDKSTVANYTDALSGIKGLATASVNSVTAGTQGVVFNLTVPITSAAAGGRWTSKTGSTSGGH